MEKLQTIVLAIIEEDRSLRQLMADFPRSALETIVREGSLSFKDTLGHLAFWDDFTCHFFRCKIDPGSYRVVPPADFEKSSQEAIDTMDKLPFGEVLARYLEATGAMLEFLDDHWKDLSAKERNDFWVPVKHRKQHRLDLAEDLKQMRPAGLGEELRELSAPA